MNFLLVLLFAAASFYFLNAGEVFFSFLAICGLVIYLSGESDRASHARPHNNSAGANYSQAAPAGKPSETTSKVRIQTDWGGPDSGEERIGKRVGSMVKVGYNVGKGIFGLLAPAEIKKKNGKKETEKSDDKD
ncbi:hypothetical protein HY993_01135 [Candidatus Micrarchaeota archaeon]|nr:hypothetical protein [Candidatus Micrarchaeota archaeon]